MNRNAIWRRPEKVPLDGIKRMNRFWSDESSRQAAYLQSKQANLCFEPDNEKQPNSAIVAAFRDQLKKVAGFGFVPEPLPMTNSKKAVIYCLFFASVKPVAEAIIKDIFDKYRYGLV